MSPFLVWFTTCSTPPTGFHRWFRHVASWRGLEAGPVHPLAAGSSCLESPGGRAPAVGKLREKLLESHGHAVFAAHLV